MRTVVIAVAGALMLLSSIAHTALGWPAMAEALRAAGAPADLAGALSVGWYFGGATMVASGLIVLTSALRLRRRDLSGILPVRIVGATWLLFGVAALVARDLNPHFLLFVVLGGLAVAPTLGLTYEAKPADGRER